MEWVAVNEPYLHENTKDFGTFQPEQLGARATESRLIQVVPPANSPKGPGELSLHRSLDQQSGNKWSFLPLPGQQSWNKLSFPPLPDQQSQDKSGEASGPSTGIPEEPRYVDPSTQPGFSLLLCGRPPPTSSGPRSTLFKVPIPKDHFSNIIEKFHIHKRIVRVIQNGRTYMDASYLPQDPPLSTKSKDASIPNHIYTANHYSDLNNYKDGLAFAATYLAGSGSSCGIIFGCTLQDIEKVEVMLEACETSWNHPLLLPCMFLELQTERLSAMADLLGTRSETTQLELENLRDQGKNDFPRGITNSLINLNKDSSTIGEGLRAAIRQLSKLISHSEALLTAQEQAGASVQSNGFLLHDTRRFIARFKEINFVYENLIASCRIDAQFTTLAADVHSNEISRRSTLMATILTFIAMVYLPATAMATILAMPIFKFDADWRDIFGHPAPTSKDDSSSAPSSTSALDSATLTASPSSSPILDVPVVSYYIWVYIGMSVGLTWVTVEAWWLTAYMHSNRLLERSLTIMTAFRCIKFAWRVVSELVVFIRHGLDGDWLPLANATGRLLTCRRHKVKNGPTSDTNNQSSQQEQGQATATPQNDTA